MSDEMSAYGYRWHEHASSRTSLMINRTKRVTRAGTLEKKGTGKGFGGRRNWTERWLVLTDFEIEWHDSEKACDAGSDANGSVELKGGRHTHAKGRPSAPRFDSRGLLRVTT
jgi:hypothetical protein